MYGMTQTTAIPSSSPSSGPSGLLPMVRKVRTSVTPIRGAGPSDGRPTSTRTSSSLHSFKGQKWSSFLENADSLRESERKVEERDDAGGSVMRLDSREMAIYGVCPETDRFTAVVCHYCGIVVKPQALKFHIKRHASDPTVASALQAVWAETKSWTEPEVATSSTENSQLKPPLTVSLVQYNAKGSSTVSALLDGPEARDPGSLYSFKGQKWTTFLKSVDQMRDTERRAEDRVNCGAVDGSESLYGGVDADRFTGVVCHFCGSVVKPQALQAHMNRHATDPVDVWPDGKTWETADGDSTACLDSQLKPPMTATACMSSGLPILQHGTSPSKGTTAPSHPDSIESLDLLSENLSASTAKVVRRVGRGRGRQPGAREREYDPDRHCGVIVESGKPCTRTLTCKSHALSLRRQVAGRTVPFDRLLLEHRNSRAARTSMSVPDAESSNSSSSFDIERKSLSGSSSNSSCGAAPMESPLRHGEEEDETAPQTIKLTDCSVTLNKLKREHTTVVSGKAKRQLIERKLPPVMETVGELPPETLLDGAPEQLTVTVPLSMISVMNLSATVPPAESTTPAAGLFTLSSRTQRNAQRSKLHLLRRQVKGEEGEVTVEPGEEFPDIDTWHSAIPRPCQVNSMRLRRIGGGSILSRRFCNFRKALLANMSSSMAATPASSGSAVGAVASLLGRSGVSTAKHTAYLDKVNFPGERIKV